MRGELEILLKNVGLIWNKHSWTNTLGKKIPKCHFLLNKRKICLEGCPREIKIEIYVFVCSYMKHIILSEGNWECWSIEQWGHFKMETRISNCYRNLKADVWILHCIIEGCSSCCDHRPGEDGSVLTPRGQEAQKRQSEFSEGPWEWLGDSEILAFEEVLSKLWLLSSKRKDSGGVVDLTNVYNYLPGAR